MKSIKLLVIGLIFATMIFGLTDDPLSAAWRCRCDTCCQFLEEYILDTAELEDVNPEYLKMIEER